MARLAGDELQFKAVAILADGTSAALLGDGRVTSPTPPRRPSTSPASVAAKAGGTATIAATLVGKSGRVTLEDVAPLVPGNNTPPTATITSPAECFDVTDRPHRRHGKQCEFPAL